jgi:hypothetical protein
MSCARAVSDSLNGSLAGWLVLTVLHTGWLFVTVFHTGSLAEFFSTPAGAVQRFSTPAGAQYSSALSDFGKSYNFSPVTDFRQLAVKLLA